MRQRSVATIGRVEVVDGPVPITDANVAALRRALEQAGTEFIDENGGGPGVRLRGSGSDRAGIGWPFYARLLRNQ